MHDNLKYSVMLVMVSLLWGAAYPIMKLALADSYASPSLVMAVRFLLAFLFLLIFFFKYFIHNFRKEIILPVVLISVILFLDYIIYITGLQFTTSINSGFYTGIAVVFVPFFALVFDRESCQKKALLSVFITAIGIYFLSSNDGMVSFNKGDILSLFSAVLFALYIVLSGKHFKGFDPLCVSIIQMAVVGSLAFIASLILEGRPVFIHYSGNTWIALIILGVLCTAVPFFLQHYAQHHFSPMIAAIIYSLMPLFTALLSMIMLEEKLFWRGYLGGVLIIVAIILARIKPKEEVANATDNSV